MQSAIKKLKETILDATTEYCMQNQNTTMLIYKIKQAKNVSIWKYSQPTILHAT